MFVEGTSSWNDELAPVIRDRVGGGFREGRVGEGFDLRVTMDPPGHVAQEFRPVPKRYLFRDSDRAAVVQVAQNMCAFNQLAPYESFEAMLPIGKTLFTAYLEAARPSRVEWLALRYVNRIVLPAPDAPVERFLTVAPRTPSAVIGKPLAFLLQVGLDPFEGGMASLELQRLPSDESGRPVFVLDLFSRTTEAPEPRWEPIEAWVRKAHDVVEAAFELSITDEARRLFGEVKP